jgi:hypothetical protein
MPDWLFENKEASVPNTGTWKQHDLIWWFELLRWLPFSPDSPASKRCYLNKVRIVGIQIFTFVPEAPGGFIAQYENNLQTVYGTVR